MNLNLHILIEDLEEWQLRGELPSDRLGLSLSYPFVLAELPSRVETGVLAVMCAEDLPVEVPGRRCQIVCLGEPPKAWLGVPGVLWTPRDAPITDLMNDITRAFWRYSCWERDVMRIASEKLPLSEIGTVTQPLFKNSIGALGASFRYLFISYPEVDAPSEAYTRYRDVYSAEGSFMNDRDMVAMVNDAQYEDVLASDKPVRFESEGYGCTALVQNVRVGETVVAQVVTNDLVAPLTARDEALLHHLGGMLSRLLAHNLVPEKPICRLLSTYGWRMDDPYCALVVEPGDAAGAHEAFDTLVMTRNAYPPLLLRLTRLRAKRLN